MRNFNKDYLKPKLIYSSLDIEDGYYVKYCSNKTKYIYGDYLKFEVNKDLNKPIVIASFVSSIDGKIAFNDTKRGCPVALASKDKRGGELDFWTMMMIRAHSDALIIGSGTLKDEPNAIGIIYDLDLQQERIENGLSANPVSILVSQSGEGIDYNHKIFNLDTNLIIIASKKALNVITKNIQKSYYIFPTLKSIKEVEENKEKLKSLYLANKEKVVIIAQGEDVIDNKVVFKILKEIGFNVISCEASYYSHSLIKDKIINEMFLNYSGIYIGGDSPSIATRLKGFNFQENPDCRCISIYMSSEYFLYTRWRFEYNS